MKLYNSIRYYTKKFASYHISTCAASASFFIMSSLMPLMMLIFSVLSYTPFQIGQLIEMVSGLIPASLQGLFSLITEDLMTINVAALSLSAVAVFWTAGKSVLGLVDGLNAIAEVNDTRNFVLKRVVCIIYMLLMILLIVLNLALQVFEQWIHQQLGRFFPRLAIIFGVILQQKGIAMPLVMTLVLVMIYTVFPGKRMRFYMQIPGAVFTALGWSLFSRLFSLYVDYFPSASALYGSLGIFVVAMLWLYLSMYILFLGAVVNRMYPPLFWKGYVIYKYRRGGKEFLEEADSSEEKKV